MKSETVFAIIASWFHGCFEHGKDRSSQGAGQRLPCAHDRDKVRVVPTLSLHLAP
jgi:hypothetical protein